MSHWICCNSCFKSPGSDRQLAVTSCGHVICSVCFPKGKKGECLICKAKCQLSLLSDKNEKMKQAIIKMQQEMQQMSKQITEQNAYISKLEVTLQQRLQSKKDFCVSGSFKPASSVTQIPYSSPVSLSQHLTTTSLIENMETERGLLHKSEMSGSVSRLCVISPPQDGRIGTVHHRAANPATMGSHLVRSATVSRQTTSSLRESTLTSSNNVPYHRTSPWETPVFKLPPAYKYPSMSSLGPTP